MQKEEAHNVSMSIAGTNAAEVGRRFRELREAAQYNQLAASEQLGLSRQALSRIEKGESFPSVPTLLRAQEVYHTSYAYLLEGKQLTPVSPGQIEKTTLQPVAVTIDHDNTPNIVMVPVKAQAGYAAHRLEQEVLENFPTFNLPGYKYRNNTYRAFEVSGDSMEPSISNGDILICSLVTDWQHLWPGHVYVIVLQDDVLVKRLEHNEADVLLLSSDNRFYQSVEITLAEVTEIWRVTGKLTQNIAAPSNEIKRLEEKIENLERLLREQ